MRWAYAAGRGAAWIIVHVIRYRRSYVLNVLQRSFPEKTPKELRALYSSMFQHQARNMVELLQFAGGREADLAKRLEFISEEIVKQALELGKGVLILIAHIGNYDLMGLFAARVLGYPVTIITKTISHEGLHEVIWELRQKTGLKAVPPQNAYRACLRALRQKELVGFMLDQNRPAQQGVFVEFFGKLASTTPGLALMSAHTGAPVVPVFMLRAADGRHVLEAKPMIEPPPDRKAETLRDYTARYTRVIEEEIRRDPAQWLWLHKRWKSRPLEEGGGEDEEN